MKKLLCMILLAGICFIPKTESQIIIRNGSASACNGLFYDSGGANGDYQAFESYTFTICSDDPNRTHISLGFNEVDIRPGDELCFFDGRSTSDSLLGCASDFAGNFNSIIQASARNSSGCITVRFRSDGSNQGKGWSMWVSCNPSCQTIKAQITATIPPITPADTGWINACPNTTIVNFKAKGIYPLNDIAYHQSDTIHRFEWNFGDGEVAYGTDVSHVYKKSGGYYARLTITDSVGCQNINFIKQRVRVAPKPTFRLSNIPSQICAGTEVRLKGSSAGLDPNYQVSVASNTATFTANGTRSERLFIPDDPSREYRTSIWFSDFGPGQVLTNVNDLLRVFVNMEHSWARDLEIKVTCPNQQSAILHRYDVGTRLSNRILIGRPNRTDNDIFLNDSTRNAPGFGDVYSWTNAATRTWSSYTTPSEISLPSGNYRPEQAFSRLLGCPLNGEWSLSVKDLFQRDNGWIFAWGIDFAQSLYPQLETFRPAITSHNWLNNNYITQYMRDSIVARPANAGTANFTYRVSDNFGCTFDTTVNVQVLPPQSAACTACDIQYTKLKDTTICPQNPVALVKTTNARINPSVTFEAFPNAEIDALRATIAAPYTSTLTTSTLFPRTITDVTASLDSVCFDIGTFVPKDLIVDLRAPSGQQVRLINQRAGFGGNMLRNVCFSTQATDNIATATPPFSNKEYQPEGGVNAWNVLNGATLNGDWKLLVSDIQGTNLDTIFRWSLTFKSGNGLKYSWFPTNGLSCNNCAIPNATPSVSTTYIVTVVDSFQCTHIDTVRVNVNDSLAAPSLSVVNLNFNLIQFGWAAVSGATGYEISINGGPWIRPNGTLTHTVTNLRSGDEVDFRVRALGGTAFCGARQSALRQKTQDCIATIGIGANRRLLIDSIPCFGGQSPVINFAFANGQAPFTFIIDTFRQNIGYFTNKIGAGRHTAIFIDGTGCSDTLVFYIGQPNPLTMSFRTDSVRCSGESNGRINITTNGGSGSYIYSLNNSPLWRNTPTFDSLRAGQYSLRVEDQNGCSRTDTVFVRQPDSLRIAVTRQNVRCFGGRTGTANVSITGGTAPYSVVWSNGKTTTNNDSLVAGTYRVTVTDAKGCFRIDSVTITQNPRLVITTLQDSVRCFGTATGNARARATGGSAPYVFQWSNNQFDSISRNLSAGYYRVTVIDGVGCSDTAGVAVLQPALLKIDTLRATNTLCSGTASGTGRVVASGGVLPYSYAWLPNNATTPSVSGLTAGLYTVSVRDRNGCTATDTVRVNDAPALTLQSVSIARIRCFGDTDGWIKVNVTGGTGTLSYRWSTTPAQTRDSLVNVGAGRYRVTVTDANSCSLTVDTALTQPTRLNATISQFTDIKCKGGSDGTAVASASGGTPFLNGNIRYLYQWSDTARQQTVTAFNLGLGAYVVTVQDSNGCTDTANVFISEPATGVTAVATQTRLACFGQANAEARVTASGGTGTYVYRWNNLQTTQTATNLTRGRYFVTATDFNGCRGIDTIIINSYDSIAIQLSQVSPRCYGENNGSITIRTVTGGAGNNDLRNYFYQWNTTPVQTTPSATSLRGDRTYSVRVIDAEGCQNTAFVYLSQPGPIELSLTSKPVSCFGRADGEAQVNAIGPFNSFTFNWSSAARFQSTQRAVALTAGRYAVTVTDSTGCRVDSAITVTQPTRLRLLSKTSEDNRCVGDTLGKISIDITGGVPNYNFLWSSNDVSSSLKNLRSGTYIVTVTDANGCTLLDTTTIKSPPSMDGEVSALPVKCFGNSDGRIIVDAFGGTPPYQFSTNGKTYNGINELVGLRAGTYDIFVRDANGCLWFDNVTVATPPRFTLQAIQDLTINLGDSTQLFANPQNNQGRVTFTWKGSYDGTLSCSKCPTPTAKPMFNITYAIAAIDSAGCRASDSIKVTVVKPRNVFVPTGFSPNNDFVNDKLIVHGRKGTKITLFRVYDRWGELLYEVRDFNVNDENAGWDGTFKGQSMNSGMYVWYIEAQYVDGAKEVMKGSTTLIR